MWKVDIVIAMSSAYGLNFKSHDHYVLGSLYIILKYMFTTYVCQYTIN